MRNRHLSSSSQEYVDDESLTYNYFYRNMIGQYLDQIIGGAKVSELERVTTPQYITEDDKFELLFEVPESQDLEPWKQVADELCEHAAEKAYEFILGADQYRETATGTSELDRWVGARLVWQGYYYLDRDGERYEAELDWVESPFGVMESITYNK